MIGTVYATLQQKISYDEDHSNAIMPATSEWKYSLLMKYSYLLGHNAPYSYSRFESISSTKDADT